MTRDPCDFHGFPLHGVTRHPNRSHACRRSGLPYIGSTSLALAFQWKKRAGRHDETSECMFPWCLYRAFYILQEAAWDGIRGGGELEMPSSSSSENLRTIESSHAQHPISCHHFHEPSPRRGVESDRVGRTGLVPDRKKQTARCTRIRSDGGSRRQLAS